MVLQLDASTAVAFMNGTVRRSKLAHIENNQEWVILMRDTGLFRGEWIPGRENLADVGTKLQGSQLFCPLVTELCQLTKLTILGLGGNALTGAFEFFYKDATRRVFLGIIFAHWLLPKLWQGHYQRSLAASRS